VQQEQQDRAEQVVLQVPRAPAGLMGQPDLRVRVVHLARVVLLARLVRLDRLECRARLARLVSRGQQGLRVLLERLVLVALQGLPDQAVQAALRDQPGRRDQRVRQAQQDLRVLGLRAQLAQAESQGRRVPRDQPAQQVRQVRAG